MNVPNAIADKVQIYLAHQKVARKFFDEIWNWLIENTGYEVDVMEVFLTDTPTGTLQPEGDYDDNLTNRYFLPIEGSTQYLGCTYRSTSELIGNEDL